MKIRDSGMPAQEVWEPLFDVPRTLDRMGLDATVGDVAEFGGGFGTFTIPVARRISGVIRSFDIDTELVQIARDRSRDLGIENVQFQERDLLTEGTGLAAGTIDYVMLFNILHHFEPSILLAEARRILKPGGRAGIAHWRSDIPTPRGPDLTIRPRPDAIHGRLLGAGWEVSSIIDLPPYHFGYVATVPAIGPAGQAIDHSTGSGLAGTGGRS
jgi:SAM-dependent methyltransferase